MNHAAHLPLEVQRVRLRAILYMILASFCFSAVELIGGYFLETVSLVQLIWGRYAVHLAFMLIVLAPRYKSRLVKSANLKLQILRSLTMVAMPACFILAINRMAPHDVWSVYWVSPLMMLALSTWVLHEPAGNKRWVAALVGLGGMLLIHQPGMGIFNPAALLALGSGLAISLHLMFSRILRYDHPLTSLFHTALWVFIVMSFVVPFLWQSPTPRDIIAMIFVGLVGLLTLLVLARAGELMPLSVVASFSYTEGIWGVVLNALLFSILPSKRVLLGALVIGAVTAYLFHYELSQSDNTSLNADEV